MTEKKMYEFSHIHQPTLFAEQELADGLGINMDRLETIYLSAGRTSAIRLRLQLVDATH